VPTPRFSLAGRLALIVGWNVLAVCGIAAGLAAARLPPLTIFLVAAFAGAVLTAWSLSRFWRPVRATLQAVTDGVRSFHENDFGLRLAVTGASELRELIVLYNRMADTLRLERSEIYQRELLLDTLLQGAPMGILLVNELDRIVYANSAARQLVGGTRRLPGRSLEEALASAPEPMRQALASGGDVLFTTTAESPGAQEEKYRVVQREFLLNTQRQRLIVVERITPELRRQEVEVWKKVIRVMSHELNNSVAPISSLFHSARLAAGRPEQAHRLDDIFRTIEERVAHLRDFLEGYARFAKLPPPRKETVDWPEFLDGVRLFYPFRLAGDVPEAPGHFDPLQVQQVLINLLKNAEEAGSPSEETAVELEPLPGGGAVLRVLDRGKGMDDEAMRNALVPFYSSKRDGSGLGLPLCTEILSAHGGALRLERRAGGGTVVTCTIPGVVPSGAEPRDLQSSLPDRAPRA
jgi:two-component system nitrogen regulation sensor histidine kinase NtrY